jgi:hypothetical protein
VPHSFTLQYIDASSLSGQFVFKEIRISPTGNQPEDNGQQSGMQIIDVGISNTRSRLINTPSFGGAAGIEQDRENIASIMSTLACFERLHGIAILLKSNQYRLSDTFRRNMHEFFTHLHKDAPKNIVFGFTNTRASNYEPGDTIEPLKEMFCQYNGTGVSLGKDTAYCFDSESFHFLAAHKRGAVMGNPEDFRGRWQRSAKEARRLLQHFQSQEPHIIERSISLSLLRESVLRFSKLMAISSQQIRNYIRPHKIDKKELSEKKQQGIELRKLLYAQKVDLVDRPLDMPRIECIHLSCTGLVYIYGFTVFKSKKICLDPCYTGTSVDCFDLLGGHDFDFLGVYDLDFLGARNFDSPEAPNCEIFSERSCKKCGHDQSDHKPVFHEQQEILVSVVDHSVEQALERNASDIAQLEKTINTVKATIYDASHKHKETIRFSLALYDCTTPYSDANFDYYDYLLVQELVKADGDL